MDIPEYIEFKVAAVSDNTNSFGLRGHVMIARNGVAYQAGANSINSKKQGDIVKVRQYQNGYDADGAPKLAKDWANLGFEIPERLPDAPDNVVAEVWG